MVADLDLYGPTRLRLIIDEALERLRATVPVDREAALRALLRVQEQEQEQGQEQGQASRAPEADLITGQRLANLGGNRALQVCLTATATTTAPSPTTAAAWEDWALGLQQQCAQLAAAEVVLAHCETGFMQLHDDGIGAFDAWITTKRPATGWLERADFDWWADWSARRARVAGGGAGKGQAQRGQNAGAVEVGSPAQRAAARVGQLAQQLGYPPDAVIGGGLASAKTYLGVLRELLRLAYSAADRGDDPAVQAERTLATEIAAALRSDPAVIADALAAFTLSAENAAYHAAVPGVAAAPLVRVAHGRVLLSLQGLSSEPLLFVTRELRRRDAQAYNNTAHYRETAFRDDLYALFSDKRFVTSTSRVELRRDSGNIRTDIDAVIFDRKTGTLGFFELKSQDPFARSAAEVARQRDNVLYANRQVAGVLAWLNHKGAADELLNRVDRQTALKFKVHRVYPFVLGRYLAHFADGDGAEPDRRAAWGTWPQVLRLLDGQSQGQSIGGANPLASLFTRLAKDMPLRPPPLPETPQALAIGGVRLTVYPSHAAYLASHPRR